MAVKILVPFNKALNTHFDGGCWFKPDILH